MPVRGLRLEQSRLPIQLEVMKFAQLALAWGLHTIPLEDLVATGFDMVALSADPPIAPRAEKKKDKPKEGQKAAAAPLQIPENAGNPGGTQEFSFLGERLPIEI